MTNYEPEYDNAPEPAADAAAPEIFSTKDAAAYLGLAEVTIKWHVHTRKDLVPDGYLSARTMWFTRATLDAFRERRRR